MYHTFFATLCLNVKKLRKGKTEKLEGVIKCMVNKVGIIKAKPLIHKHATLCLIFHHQIYEHL